MKNKKLNNKEYEWDLEDLLKNKSIDQLFDEWVAKQNEVLKLYPTFYKSLANFRKWMKLDDELEVIENRLENYVSNKLNEDLINNQWLGLAQKINIVSNQISSQMSDYVNVVIKNKKLIQSYLTKSDLKKYQKAFDDTFKLEPHILTPEVEKAIREYLGDRTITQQSIMKRYGLSRNTVKKYASIIRGRTHDTV